MTEIEGSRAWTLTKRLLVLAPLLVLGNAAGAALRYPDIGAAVLYPPYAFLTAALVNSPRRDWIWYIVVGCGTHLVTHWPHWPLSWVLLADAANVVRVLVAALLLNRLLGVSPRLVDARSIAHFLVAAVVVAPAAGATIGAANVVLHGGASPYWQPWSAWFVSNAITGLTILPASIVGFALTAGLSRWNLDRSRTIEGVWLLASLAATSLLMLLPVSGWQSLLLPLCAPLPVLIWAAVRFGPGGASVSLAWVTFAAIWSFDRATGALPADSVENKILALQIFVLFTAVPVLCLAAVASARQTVIALHRALLASLQEQVAILDANGVVLEVSDSWRRSSQEPCAQPFHRVSPGDNYVAACGVSAAAGDTTALDLLAGVQGVLSGAHGRFEIEHDLVHSSRRETYAKSIEALQREEGGAVIVRHNITARRLIQTEIDLQRLELSHLARVSVLGQLSGAFAHELNQPLHAILSNVEAARLRIRHGSPDLAYLDDVLLEVITAVERADSMIQRLHDLLKRGDLRVAPVGIKELIDDVLSLAKTELLRRQVEVRVLIDPTLPPIWGDKVQLQQVLLNLILNAIEAMTPAAAANRQIDLTASHETAAGVHLAVRDTGSGIPPELIDRLFEPFVTSKADGLGLGLSICRTIIAAHGGRIWGLNNPNGGATIHCVLPTTQPGPALVSAVKQSATDAARER